MASYADELLILNDDSLVLDTGLTAREAAQAKLMQFLIEPGYIAEINGDGSVSFSQYTFQQSFEETEKGRKNSSVHISGPAYKGTPLIEILNGDDIEKARTAVNKISRIVEASLEADMTLPTVGPLGTLLGDDGTVLFLPYTLLNKALYSRGDAFLSKYEGCWRNTALTFKDGLRFTVAAYAYKVLSGTMPFPSDNSYSRVEDYYDRNFNRLNWFCRLEKGGSTVNTDGIFSAVEQDLSCAAPEMETSNKKKTGKKKKPQVFTTAVPELPAFDNRVITDAGTQKSYQLQQKSIKRARFFRKNNGTITACTIGLVVLLLVGTSWLKDLMSKPTTLGMEPQEVVETFYEAFDTLDSVLFDSTRTDGAGESISNIIATFFVTAKMRESYEGITTYTPSKWLNTLNPDTANIYGISHMTITAHPEKSTDTMKVYSAHYFILHTEAPELLISEVNETVTVMWKKDRWLVSGLETEDEEYKEDYEAFFEKLRALVPANTSYDAAEVIEALSPEYPWLPTVEETKNGLQQIIDKYNSEKI